MIVIALRLVLALVGAALLLTSIDSLIQVYNSPIAKKELLVTFGRLGAVGVCKSADRYNKAFKFTIKREPLPITVSQGCPNKIYTVLRESIGKSIQMSYTEKRGSFFKPVIEIYDLNINELSLIKYQDKVAYINKVKPYAIFMFFLAGFLGLIVIGGAFNIINLNKLMPNPSFKRDA